MVVGRKLCKSWQFELAGAFRFVQEKVKGVNPGKLNVYSYRSHRGFETTEVHGPIHRQHAILYSHSFLRE